MTNEQTKNWEEEFDGRRRKIMERIHIKERNCDCCKNTMNLLELLDDTNSKLSEQRKEAYREGLAKGIKDKNDINEHFDRVKKQIRQQVLGEVVDSFEGIKNMDRKLLSVDAILEIINKLK